MKADTTKKIEKKKRIIETAYQLFSSMGISATAVDDVVKAAGIARGTFYLYFKDKSDLLEQLIFYKSGETMKELLRRAQTELDIRETDLLATVRRFAELYIDFYADHKDVMMVLNKNMTSFLRYFPTFFDEESEALYGDLLDRFEAYGYTRDQANRTVYIVVEMLSAVCADAVIYGEPFSLPELRGTLMDAAVTLIESGVKPRAETLSAGAAV